LGKVESTIANTRAGTVEAMPARQSCPRPWAGRIEVLAVKEGQKVKKGQLLIKLWNDDQQAQSALALTQVENGPAACDRGVHAGRQFGARSATPDRVAGEELRFRIQRGAARAEAQAKRAACDAAKSDVTQTEARRQGDPCRAGTDVLFAPFDGNGRQDRR